MILLDKWKKAQRLGLDNFIFNLITVYWPTCDKIQHKESFLFSSFTAHIYWYWLLMLIAHYRHCPGDHEIWLILYLWLLMGGSKHLDGGFDAIIKYFICCSKLFDKCSQSQRCFKTTILSKLDTPLVMCLASNCHKWKGIPIIPDWNVFHHKAWKSVYPGAYRDHPPILQFTWNNSWWGSAYCHGVWNVRAYCEYYDRFQ